MSKAVSTLQQQKQQQQAKKSFGSDWQIFNLQLAKEKQILV
jgi:hypothetical protein